MTSLGTDLLRTSAVQRRITLSRPLWLLGLYALAATAGATWALPIIVFLQFVAVVTATHDVVHEALGLSPRQTEVCLFLLGAVLFESGHAYRITHRRHHRVFPGPDDPEGRPAKIPWYRVLLESPCFLPRLWCWAFRRAGPMPRQRGWLVLEGAWFLTGAVGAGLLYDRVPEVTAYFAMVVVGSWSYPLLTVHLPHRGYGRTPVHQTHTLRGTILPRLFLELTYHLEHHLYPEVPSHNLPALSRRVEPWLLRQGVVPRRTI